MPKLKIIFENDDYIVINKKAGLISEKNSYEDDTIENLVYKHLLKNKRKPYVGIIHRLDRVTSGVLIFAKKKSILVSFNALFSKRKVQKIYLAIVKDKPQKTKDNLHHYLKKNTKHKRADIVASKSKGALECMLSYRVIGKSDIGYILEVKPTTGRFHQIRAQLASIGLPIIGDKKYGSDQEYLPLSICLHAWKLTYLEAGTTVSKTFEASLPKNRYWKFESI